MAGLRHGFAGSEPVREGASATPPPGSRAGRESSGNTGMAELHESIARLLAARGQWRQAYHHLRSAHDLMSTTETVQVPNQLRHEVNRLRRERAEAREQSRRDSLTASYNRRYLHERLADMLSEHTGGSGSGLALALVDLDWFKQVNDTHGHVLGDRVLQDVVELLQQALPGEGFCARYGGEEFVLVLPDIEPTTAVSVCEQARARVEKHPWTRLVAGLRVTISIGLAHERTAGQSAPPSAEQQLISADALLYAAKQAGRNAVAYRCGKEVRLAGMAAGRRAAGPRPNTDY